MHKGTSVSHVLQQIDREVRPSLLVAGGDADLRLFLRGSLRRWYQVAEVPTGDQVISHLTHCPPKALIAGPLRTGRSEEIISALCTPEAPPVLRLWAVDPPGGGDETLRYPFTRAELLRAVTRMVGDEEAWPDGDVPEAEKEKWTNASR